jgi:alkylation response protein AidB-like acyl-CoA dehydrogenase
MAAQLLPQDHLASVLSGERIILAAWQETVDSIDLTADTVLRNGRLNGRKLCIPMAAGADAFLVTVPGGLALVEREAPGVSLEIQKTQDGGNLGTLILDNAPAETVEGDAIEALEHTIMARAAYLFGLTDRAFNITLEHMKARERFGRRSGALPVLRHRAADMEIQVSLTRATIGTASYALDNAPTLGQRQAAVSRAKLRAADAAMVVTRTCMQLHGGVCHTDAADIGLYVRKAMTLSPLYGSPSVHRRRFRTIAPEIADE